MQNLLFKIITATLLLISCDSESGKKPVINGNVTEIPTDDREMNLAIKKAKETFNQFDTAYKNGNFDSSTFLLKVRFQINENGEHIWVSDLVGKNGSYSGIIDEDAVYSDTIKAGRKVTVTQDNLSDWMYVNNEGVLEGGYTIRALRNKMSAEERASFDSAVYFKIKE